MKSTCPSSLLCVCFNVHGCWVCYCKRCITCVPLVTPVMPLWIKQGCCDDHPAVFDFMLPAQVTSTTHRVSDDEILWRIIMSKLLINLHFSDDSKNYKFKHWIFILLLMSGRRRKWHNKSQMEIMPGTDKHQKAGWNCQRSLKLKIIQCVFFCRIYIVFSMVSVFQYILISILTLVLIYICQFLFVVAQKSTCFHRFSRQYARCSSVCCLRLKQ